MTDSRERQTLNLLALRDGEATHDMSDDVSGEQNDKQSDKQSRPAAEAEFNQLKQLKMLRQALNELPDIEPDSGVWDKIQARAAKPPPAAGLVVQPRGMFRTLQAPYAMAAGLLLAVLVGVLSMNVARETPPAGTLAHDATLDSLRYRSQRLEPLVQGAGLYRDDAAVRAVKYRIADLDTQIASYPERTSLQQRQVQQLWSKRVALLESLAEGRRARAALQPAVY